MTDKTGADAAEFRAFTRDGRTFREPVITEAHRQEMRSDLGAAIGAEDPLGDHLPAVRGRVVVPAHCPVLRAGQ